MMNLMVDRHHKWGSIKKQVVSRKYFSNSVEFESKTSKGKQFLDYCSKKWSLPGENVVEAQSKYEEIVSE